MGYFGLVTMFVIYYIISSRKSEVAGVNDDGDDPPGYCTTDKASQIDRIVKMHGSSDFVPRKRSYVVEEDRHRSSCPWWPKLRTF